jgi:hypothetical protein
MSVEIEFPVEVMVWGVPPSLGASTARKEAWKERIRSAARGELPEGHFASQEAMKVTIYYFTEGPAEADIDNIVKPIFDSLSRLIYIDDRQVERLVVQKFELGRDFEFREPSATLKTAIHGSGSRVYLQVAVSVAGEVP